MIGPEEKDEELNPTTQEWIAEVVEQELVDTLTEMDDEED